MSWERAQVLGLAWQLILLVVRVLSYVRGKGGPGVGDSHLGVTCLKCEPRLLLPGLQASLEQSQFRVPLGQVSGRVGPGRARERGSQAAELDSP